MDNKPTIPGIPTPPATLPSPANIQPTIPVVGQLPGPVPTPIETPLDSSQKEVPTPVQEPLVDTPKITNDLPNASRQIIETPVVTASTTPNPATEDKTSTPLAPSNNDLEKEVKEVEMPKSGKKKVLPAIMAVVALFVVAGVAVASFYISNQLKSDRALAPNAPESKPMAGGKCSGDYGNCGSSYCVSNTCVKTCCYKENGKYNCTTAGNCFTSGDGCTGCGGGGSSSGGGPSCGAGSSDGKSCATGTAGGANNCPTSPYNFGCGNECCLNNRAVCCCTGCYPTGTDCAQHSCNNPGSCDTTKRDAPFSKTLTFSKAGTVSIFTMNGGAGSITFTGPKTVTASLAGGAASQNATSFTVNAGDTYTIKVKFNAASEQGKDAYGYIKNKAATTCGPTNSICGGNLDISSLVSLATLKSDVSGITAGGQPANTQCWGDAELGDATQDYHYNDFALILGFTAEPSSVVPNCSNVTGPNKLTLGDTGDYSAKYYAAGTGGLTDGSIFISNGENGTDIVEINDKCGTKYNCPVTNGAELKAKFTPTKVGKYWVRCRAWNDGIAECRPPKTVDGPPRFACAGGNGGTYEMLVEVVEAAPQCIASKIFEKVGNQWVVVANPGTLKAGTEIIIGVAGNLTRLAKARFKVNNGNWIESTTTMTDSLGKLYIYTAHTLVSGDYSIQSEIQ